MAIQFPVPIALYAPLASPTFTGTVTLPIAVATSLALGGATIGTNAFAVTGTATISASLAIGGATIGTDALGVTGTVSISGNTTLATAAQLLWSTDLLLGRAAAANLRHGAAAVDTGPVAQTISVQNTLTGGTSNVAGAALTITGSQGKGTGIGGAIILQVAPAGTTGTTVNPLATALTIYGSGDVGIGTGSAIATTAVVGFLLIPTCAGTPTGVATNAGTGKAALIFDTTNSQLWVSVSGSSWKQPKTPAAAALITWQ